MVNNHNNIMDSDWSTTSSEENNHDGSLPKAALRLDEDRYQQGVDEIFDVLESQRRYLNDRTQIIEVRRLLFVNPVDFLLALDGGIEAADSPLSPLSSAPPVLSQN